MNLNIDKNTQAIISQRVDSIMFTLYHYRQNDSVQTLSENTNIDTNVTTSDTTALVVLKDSAIINPDVVYKIKKTVKLSIRSFLISVSLTILNLFI